MSAHDRTTPGFTADRSLSRVGHAGPDLGHTGRPRRPLATPERMAVTPAAPIRHDGGRKPPGNCMLICESFESVPDLRAPSIGRGSPYTRFGRRMVGRGCSWVCVPDPF